ncbi:MAG: DegT/DnrJ/EryC1/StrS family aminotransferase [Gammaproteobacteria bacterium]|nr:MAG: DegT/DnrJ/EryC1/StrS family aminotransferase [Gammaproteobacteria bacterium]
MKVPMLDLAVQDAPLLEELRAAMLAVAGTGRYIRGPVLEAFERDFAARVGVAHAVGVASGTDALELSLQALDIGPGDEVITSAFTFFATAEVICQRGATPVFVDIDPATYTLDPEAVAAAITPRTRAVLPVHLFGHPADMRALGALAHHHGLAIVEDCAQAFGARVGDRQVGSLAVAGAFSFYPSKTLGAWGDGGMITTDSAELAARLRRLGNHGQRKDYRYVEVARNSRLDDVQAAVLAVKLRHADAAAAARRAIARRYFECLVDSPVALPSTASGCRHGWNYFTVLVPSRDAVVAGLRARGIGCGVYYATPLHRQPVFAAHCADVVLPVTDAVAARCLSLPIFPGLSDEAVDTVSAALQALVAGDEADAISSAGDQAPSGPWGRAASSASTSSSSTWRKS